MRLAVGMSTFPATPETAGRVRPAVPAPLSVRANFSWTLAGNVVYAACQWAMLAAVAKLGSPEMVGQFAVASALTVPVMMLLNLQLRAVEATDAKGAYRFGDYVGLRLITTVTALGVIGLLASTRRGELLWVILAVGAAKAVDSLSDILYGLLQRHERMDRVACSMMIRGPFALVALAGTLMLTGSVGWAALAMAGAWLLVLLAYDVPNALWVLRRTVGLAALDPPYALDPPCTRVGRMTVARRLDLPVLARLAWLSLPLGVVMLLISLQANVPFYLMEHYLGERDVGIFAAMVYLMAAGGQVTAALGQSASPRFADYWVRGNRPAFRRLLAQLVGSTVLLGVGAWVVCLAVGREILSLLYRPEYAAHAGVLAILMLAAVFSYPSDVLGYAATASRRIRYQPAIHLGLLAVALASGWALLGHGLAGIAVSVLATRLVGLVSFAVLLRTRGDGG